MASRKRKQRSLSAGRTVMLAIVVVLLVGIGFIVKNIISLSLEKRELTQQNSDLTNKRDELTAELENVNDLDYIEEQARKLLHMIKPGEILYILNGTGHQKSEDGDTNIELPTQPNQDYSEDETSEEDNYSEEDNSESNGSETESSEENYSGEPTEDDYSEEEISEDDQYNSSFEDDSEESNGEDEE